MKKSNFRSPFYNFGVPLRFGNSVFGVYMYFSLLRLLSHNIKIETAKLSRWLGWAKRSGYPENQPLLFFVLDLHTTHLVPAVPIVYRGRGGLGWTKRSCHCQYICSNVAILYLDLHTPGETQLVPAVVWRGRCACWTKRSWHLEKQPLSFLFILSSHFFPLSSFLNSHIIKPTNCFWRLLEAGRSERSLFEQKIMWQNTILKIVIISLTVSFLSSPALNLLSNW